MMRLLTSFCIVHTLGGPSGAIATGKHRKRDRRALHGHFVFTRDAAIFDASSHHRPCVGQDRESTVENQGGFQHYLDGCEMSSKLC
jgi:hypothetical protein